MGEFLNQLEGLKFDSAVLKILVELLLFFEGNIFYYQAYAKTAILKRNVHRTHDIAAFG